MSKPSTRGSPCSPKPPRSCAKRRDGRGAPCSAAGSGCPDPAGRSGLGMAARASARALRPGLERRSRKPVSPRPPDPPARARRRRPRLSGARRHLRHPRRPRHRARPADQDRPRRARRRAGRSRRPIVCSSTAPRGKVAFGPPATRRSRPTRHSRCARRLVRRDRHPVALARPDGRSRAPMRRCCCSTARTSCRSSCRRTARARRAPDPRQPADSTAPAARHAALSHVAHAQRRRHDGRRRHLFRRKRRQDRSPRQHPRRRRGAADELRRPGIGQPRRHADRPSLPRLSVGSRWRALGPLEGDACRDGRCRRDRQPELPAAPRPAAGR